MSNLNRRVVTALAAALGIGVSGQAVGAGFALIEDSASGMGNAFAGAAASAEDASTVFYNPAGMTHVAGRQMVLGMHRIEPGAEFTNSGSSSGVTGAPISGGDNNGGVTAYVPNLYLVGDVNAHWKYGLGINAPFGLGTHYDDNWVGRYHAIKSDLKTVNINPSVAYRASDRLSLGFGVSAQYLEVDLTSAVDFGSVCIAYMPAASCAALGMSPQQADGVADISGTNWAYGWNAGLLYQLDEATRVGFSYRSQVDQKVDGSADFTVPAVASSFTATGNFVDTGAHANVTLPAMASLSVYRQQSDKLALLADVTWTGWSVFDELRVSYDSSQPDSVTTENWQDSWRFSVGANYVLNERTLLRGGLAFDQSPVPDAQHRTARIPGNDRQWLSLGLTYFYSASTIFDVGYSHLFVADTAIDNTLETSIPTMNHTLKGQYNSSVDILSAQIRWHF